MKKSLKFLSMAVLMMSAVFISACSDDDDKGGSSESKQSKIKTIGAVYSDGTESFEFTYDANGRVTSIDNVWTPLGEEPFDPSVIEYDYSTANKLFITRDGDVTEYDLDSEGRAIKEIKSDVEWNTFEYDEDGYLIKQTETYEGVDYPKYDVEVKKDNVTEHIKYNDPIRHKTFTYLSGNNVNGIQQTSIVESSWKVVGGLFGKASKKVVNYLEYWDEGAEDEIKRTTMTYELDAEGRITKWTRGLADGGTEVFTFSYYEEVE